MSVISLLAVSQPTGVWARLIEWVHSWVGGGYGWTILVLILLVKLVLSPLDYLIKHSSKKTNLVQQKTAPQIAKLRKKYGDNQQLIQEQTQALYKREGHNMFGSCIVMLVNMVLTMVIFFTLFSGLRTLSAYQAIEQYDGLHAAYTTSMYTTYGSQADYEAIAVKVATGETLTESEQEFWDAALLTAQDAVQNEWNNVSDSWLWVENIWVTDGKSSPMPTLDALKEMASSSKNEEYVEHVNKIADETSLSFVEYNTITAMVTNKTGVWNGYYILAILAVGLSFLSQFINDAANKQKNKNAQQIVDAANPQGKSAWIMKIMLPVMMAIFVFTTNAAFGIYVVTNSIMSTLISLITTAITNKVFAKRQAEVDEYLAKEAGKIQKRLNKGAQ